METVKIIAGDLEDLYQRVEEAKDAEQEKYDNLSEGLQQSERGQNMESAVSSLESAMESLETLKDQLEEFATSAGLLDLEGAVSSVRDSIDEAINT